MEHSSLSGLFTLVGAHHLVSLQISVFDMDLVKLDQILGLNRSARLNEDIGLWT